MSNHPFGSGAPTPSMRQFGIGRGEVSAETAKALDDIATEHGASFITYREPGPMGEHRYWFSAPNDGAFDNVMHDTLEAATDAGIWPLEIKS